MLGVNLPGKIADPSDPTARLADAGRHRSGQHPRPSGRRSGRSARQLTPQTRTLTNLEGGAVTATYLTGPDGVSVNPAEPTLPLFDGNVTVPDQVLRGVALRSATLHRHRRDHPADRSPGDRDTQRAHAVRHPGVLPGQDRQRQLLRRPDDRRFDPADAHAGPAPLGWAWLADHHPAALRHASACRLFYSGNIETYGENVPALAAPPTITDVRTVIEGNTVTFSARVVGNPAAGIQEVFVTYTGEPGSEFHGEWASLDLDPGFRGLDAVDGDARPAGRPGRRRRALSGPGGQRGRSGRHRRQPGDVLHSWRDPRPRR